MKKTIFINIIILGFLMIILPWGIKSKNENNAENLWSNESPMVKFLADYYNVDPIIVISLGQRMVTYPDDVSVSLFIAGSLGKNPLNLLLSRLNKKSWAEISKTLNFDLSSMFSPIHKNQQITNDFKHAYLEYDKHINKPDYEMTLFDKEFRNLIQLKLVTTAFKRTSESVMIDLNKGKNFTSLILNEIKPPSDKYSPDDDR